MNTVMTVSPHEAEIIRNHRDAMNQTRMAKQAAFEQSTKKDLEAIWHLLNQIQPDEDPQTMYAAVDDACERIYRLLY
jgi:ribosome-associated translation inhibitor RaiA